ncbi:MAG: hypothetical protein ABUJ92_00175 [Desulfobacterales bacterium]
MKHDYWDSNLFGATLCLSKHKATVDLHVSDSAVTIAIDQKDIIHLAGLLGLTVSAQEVNDNH